MNSRTRQRFLPTVTTGRLFLLVLIVALLWPAAGTVNAAPPVQDVPSCAGITRHRATGEMLTLRDCQTAPQPEADPESVAYSFLNRYHESLSLPAGLNELRLVDVQHGLNSSHVLFQQSYAGLPVYGVYVSVHLDRDRQVQLLHNRYLPGLVVDVSSATVSAEQALELARQAIEFQASRGESPAPRQVVLPVSRTTGRLAWQVMILAAQPQGDWEVLVDAVDGQIIKRYNRLIMAYGQVFSPHASQQAGAEPPVAASQPLLRTVTLQGLDGSGWLRGEHVDLTWPAGYTPALAFDPTGAFVYEPGDPRFEEVMVYYYVDETQRYIQSLGYSDDNQPSNGIRDEVTYASAHWFDQDQSFYSVSDDALHFGDGGVPDAQDADLIIHEYAHALQHDQLMCWGGGEMDSIGEGFGDYLAASRFADTAGDPACVAEWDSRSYAPGPPYCLRRVDRERRYPEDLTGDPHVDGEIWSRVLWDLRSDLGATIADTLALESHFYMPCGATLIEAGQALLFADDNVYGGNHRAAIVATLANRGLMTLPAPRLITPNGGETLKPGDSVDVVWSPGLDLPASYEVQYSPDAGSVATLEVNFDRASLPDGFQTYGNQPWRSAGDAAQAGAIDHHQASSLALEVDLAQAGQISFRYRVSSEQGWDHFEVLVDDQVLLQASGDTGWSEHRSMLAAGPHLIVWRYRKDGTLKAGQDSAWIDDLRIDNVGTATWHDIDTVSAGSLVWQVPGAATSAAKLRVRSTLNGAFSPWETSDGIFLIGEPAAVTLSGFGAGEDVVGAASAGRLPLIPWGLLGMFGAAALGVLLESLIWRKILRR